MAKNEGISKQDPDPPTTQESTVTFHAGGRTILFLITVLFVLGATALLSFIFYDDTHSWFSHTFQDKSVIEDNPYNCYSPSSHGCARIIWRTHKFGTILLGDLFRNFRQSNSNPKIFTKPTPKAASYALPTRLDYRHVLVTRNWFHAIVSGYLYHKSGYECTVEPRGENVHHSKHYDMESHFHNKFWDTQNLYFHQRFDMSFPPRHNRSLCQYLQEESEEDGMLVTMDIALSRWYKGVVSYHDKAIHDTRTLFLCFEDLVNPFQQEKLFYQILQHLFPGIDNVTEAFQMPRHMKKLLVQQQKEHSVYNGGHASTHDVELQTRLQTLVQQFDQQFFNNTIADSNAIFSCGG